MSKKNETKVAPWVHSIAGGCGGALGAILTNPLEVFLDFIMRYASKNVILGCKNKAAVVKQFNGENGVRQIRST